MTKSTCTLPGCDNDFLARGFCAGHYARWKRQGESFDPSPLKTYLPAGTPCSADGCTRSSFAKGYCNAHWQRQHYKGSIGDKPVARRSPQWASLQERFDVYSQSEPTARGCIEWSGPAHNRSGHGLIRFYKGAKVAARVAWELNHGPIPEGLVVRHKCDNPPCVNIEHLDIGTQADNIADMVARDRDLRGARSPHAKLTDDEVIAMRARAAAGCAHAILAKEYGISRGHVSAIVNRLHWKHI